MEMELAVGSVINSSFDSLKQNMPMEFQQED